MEILQQKNMEVTKILESGWLDGKALYMYYFNSVPSANYIGQVDGEKSYRSIKDKFGDRIRFEHTYRYFDAKGKSYDFNETFLVMDNDCIIEFDTNYCEIYHRGGQDEFIKECTALTTKYKRRERRKPLEINLVIRNKSELVLKQMEIKKTKLNLNLFYEDDFKEVDAVIRHRLNAPNDKGIVLLHGLPGTGKTTYLRHLVGKIKKRILFLSPGVAADIMNPEFLQLLVNNPNSVMVIEDAENLIMDRKLSNHSSVSNLLNLSDGLLADSLNVQVICTFNNSLTLVDSALMRKGRLIAKYEFGKLSIKKAQQLSDHLGFKKRITQPMTLAEIGNPDEKQYAAPKTEVMGFRREAMMN